MKQCFPLSCLKPNLISVPKPAHQKCQLTVSWTRRSAYMMLSVTFGSICGRYSTLSRASNFIPTTRTFQVQPSMESTTFFGALPGWTKGDLPRNKLETFFDATSNNSQDFDTSNPTTQPQATSWVGYATKHLLVLFGCTIYNGITTFLKSMIGSQRKRRPHWVNRPMAKSAWQLGVVLED